MVTSQLNKRYVWLTLVEIALGVLALCGVPLLKSAILPLLIVWIAFTLLFSVLYLASIKRITVVADGLEIQSLLLPFWKRFYRFGEFDYSEASHTRNGDVLRLIKDGRRVVSIPSSRYQNYEQLRQAIAVNGKECFLARDNAEVVSEYKRLRLYGGAGAGLFFVLLMALMPIAQYVDDKDVSLGILLFSLFGVLFSGAILLAFLYPYQGIVVWRGQIDVRRLVWPFQVKYYQLADFDGCYYVTVKSEGQFGSNDEELRWLIKNGKVVLDIEESIYSNFESLKDATRTTFLGRLELTSIQAMKYSFGKKIQL